MFRTTFGVPAWVPRVLALIVTLVLTAACAGVPGDRGPDPGHAQVRGQFADQVHESEYDECHGPGNVDNKYHVYAWFVPNDWPGAAKGRAPDHHIQVFVGPDSTKRTPPSTKVVDVMLKPMTEAGSLHQDHYRPLQNPGYSFDVAVADIGPDTQYGQKFRLTVIDLTAVGGLGYKLISNEVRNNRCPNHGVIGAPKVPPLPKPVPTGSSGGKPKSYWVGYCGEIHNRDARHACQKKHGVPLT
ncbi:MAG TPA: hypothetical protein VHQ86_01350 [Candidatus Saccharimonadia bacterium]|jgi:hypothetical protein|nr:hypothetical protein [Candidatus Saccharimonadia bacterium]